MIGANLRLNISILRIQVVFDCAHFEPLKLRFEYLYNEEKCFLAC